MLQTKRKEKNYFITRLSLFIRHKYFVLDGLRLRIYILNLLRLSKGKLTFETNIN